MTFRRYMIGFAIFCFCWLVANIVCIVAFDGGDANIVAAVYMAVMITLSVATIRSRSR